MSDVTDGIRDYLASGGLFNPELMDHQRVRDLLIESRDEIERLRSEGLSRGNALGRIAVALFGDQNNRTDEECVSEAAAIGYALTGCREKVARQAAEIKRLRGLLREALTGETHGDWMMRIRETLGE